MFGQGTASSSPIGKWPIIIFVVVLLLAAIQMLRVNRRPTPTTVDQPLSYTKSGPLIVGQITIPAGEFHSQKLDLNRKARLIGTFQTGSVQRRVSVLVLKERDFELWNTNSIYSSLAETGYVPGGKIAPMLEPGGYYLLIDNRFNPEAMSLNVDFTLE